MSILIKSAQVNIRSKMLLSKDILCEMVHQSQMYRLCFEEYTDGILAGFDFYEENGVVYLSQGAIKKDNRIYVSEQRISVTEFLDSYDSENSAVNDTDMELLFLPHPEIQEAEGVSSYCLTMTMLPRHEAEKADGVSIARFNYTKGRMRGLSDAAGESFLFEQCRENVEHYSVLCQRHSMPNGDFSFSPSILSQLRAELEKKPSKNIWDIALLFEMTQNRLVGTQVLILWLKSYGMSGETPCEILKNACAALKAIPKAVETQTQPVPEPEKPMPWKY